MISYADPQQLFVGSQLVAIPHMDDGVLGCGGTLTLLEDKKAIHIVYVTDGSQSPEPVFPGRDQVPANLSQLRRREAQKAMGSLGIPQENIHFLELPDGKLMRHQIALEMALQGLIRQIIPDHILVPFRYDRHPDHLALNHAVTDLYLQAENNFKLHEYFVYQRWKMLPKGDIRAYISPHLLSTVDISLVRNQKRKALDYFETQTTRFFDWQTRPNLTATLLDAVCEEPECFLQYKQTEPGPQIFTSSVAWIRMSHQLEPVAKKWKDKLIARIRRWTNHHDGTE